MFCLRTLGFTAMLQLLYKREMLQVHLGGPKKDYSKLEKECEDVPCSLVFDTGATVKLNASQHQVLYEA